MEQIFVFKTDASEATNFELLDRLLNADGRIKRWNFDFDDCDNIFRLVATAISEKEVLKILSKCGIDAQVLE